MSSESVVTHTVNACGLCSAVEEAQELQTEERYQGIVQRKTLMDLARAQTEDLALLSAEVERLRMKNFPAFDPLTHN